MTKICKKIGNFVKSDQITLQRTYLSYARVMLEVQVGRDFPKSIGFIDEKGNSHRVMVTYDWVPSRCDACKGLGHVVDE